MIQLPEPLALTGMAAAAIAVAAWLGDRRRMHRANLDDVGFMPWTVIFLVALLVAIVLLGLAGREWFAASV